MQWGSCLLHSSETTTVAMPIAFHSASAAAKNLGCKLLFSHPPSAAIQSWLLLHSGCQDVYLQDPELPLHSNTPTLLQSLAPVHRFPLQPPHPAPFYLGGKWVWGSPRFLHPARLCCGRAQIIPLVLPQTPQSRCLIKTILSVAHAHALYT